MQGLAGIVFTFVKRLVEDRFKELNCDHNEPSEKDDVSFPTLFTRDPNNRNWPLPGSLPTERLEMYCGAEAMESRWHDKIVEAYDRLKEEFYLYTEAPHKRYLMAVYVVATGLQKRAREMGWTTPVAIQTWYSSW